jgi:hypothetical protein
MYEITLFEHRDLRGAHRHLFQSEPDLGNRDDSYFNERVSSFVISSGQWQFFTDPSFVHPASNPLGPGVYAWVEDFNIPNDSISSVKCISITMDMATVHLHTESDDKDSEDEVTVHILVNGDIRASHGPFGGGETWGNDSSQAPLPIPLSPGVEEAHWGDMAVLVWKTGDNGWNMSVGVEGHTADGRVLNLLPRTGQVRFDGGCTAHQWVLNSGWNV